MFVGVSQISGGMWFNFGHPRVRFDIDMQHSIPYSRPAG